MFRGLNAICQEKGEGGMVVLSKFTQNSSDSNLFLKGDKFGAKLHKILDKEMIFAS